MTVEEIVIAIVRTLGSLPVLRWAFIGALIAILVDFSDLFMMNLLSLGGVRNYQAFDKWVDLIYMMTFLIATLKWSGIARNVAIALFLYRIVGVITFEFVQAAGVTVLGDQSGRAILLFFPNVFEFWVVGVAAARLFLPRYRLTLKRAAFWLIVLAAAKEFQEYALHGAQWLDNYRATDVVITWWTWLSGHF